MSTRDEKIYRKLQRHLDQMPVGFPKTESGVEIKLLKHVFTPEEAEMATKLSVFPKDLDTLYLRYKRKMSLEEFEEKMENIAKKGGIFRYRKGDKTYYSNAFLVVGMFEYQLGRMTKEYADDFDQYLEEAFREEIIMKKTNQLRVIPIEESVEKENAIHTYDHLESLIRNERGTLSVADCICRKKGDLQDNKCDHIRETCFQLGGAADYYIENGLGREVSKEEALEILKIAEKEGLVLEPGNSQRPYAICACCGCHCEMLVNLKKLPKPAEFVHSNYYAELSDETCIGCGKCLPRCQMEAITLVESDKTKIGKIASLDLDRCIGCGLCVSSCPTKSLNLIKKEKVEIPPRNTQELYMKIGSNK